jgi:glutamate/tyrosine decarboxylase-like PLP-dependent enzyme
VPLGRRLRSLKLWMVLRSYGLEGLQGFVRHAAALAERFEAHILRDPRFEIAAPRRLGLVCFRLKGDEDGKATSALIEAVNASGATMMVTADVGGRVLARAAIGAASSQAGHIGRMSHRVHRREIRAGHALLRVTEDASRSTHASISKAIPSMRVSAASRAGPSRCTTVVALARRWSSGSVETLSSRSSR